MVTEEEIKNYRQTETEIQYRAFKLVQKYESSKLDFDDSVDVTGVYFHGDEIHINYTVSDTYDTVFRRERCSMKIVDFCNPDYTIGEIRKWH